MRIEQNSTGGKTVVLKQSEGGQVRAHVLIPNGAVLIKETRIYYDVATRRQFVVTAEADGFCGGCLHGQQL